MPAAVAQAPHAQLSTGHMARTSQDISPRSSYQDLAPGANDREQRKNSAPVVIGAQAVPPGQHFNTSPGTKGTSPNALRPGPPKIIVKKEPPSSPDHAVPKHRPRKLDLTNSNANRLNGPQTAAPNLGVGMQDVGIACLSPGFQTQDPGMREQLARSMSVRDQQRLLIEQRLQKNTGGKPGERSMDDHHDMPTPGRLQPPQGIKKRGPPPGLSIGVPNAGQFANERVIQSAPLNQTFTGRDAPNPHALQPRQPNGVPGAMHAPGHTANRLPPIGDVFGGMGVSQHQRASPPPGQPGAPPARPGLFQSHSSSQLATQPPQPGQPRPPTAQFPSSPGFPPPGASGQQLAPSVPPPPITNRPREYRSAEEAVAEMTQGREDLQPRLVHYGGHQPPTPPSPQPGQQGHTPTKHANYPQAPQGYPPQHAQQPPPSAGYPPGSAAHPGPPPPSARRRPRSEYEREYGNSPPLGSGPSPRGHRGAEFAHQAAHGFGPFGAGRDSPATQRAKKDEFMACVSRAYDLWHS